MAVNGRAGAFGVAALGIAAARPEEPTRPPSGDRVRRSIPALGTGGTGDLERAEGAARVYELPDLLQDSAEEHPERHLSVRDPAHGVLPERRHVGTGGDVG